MARSKVTWRFDMEGFAALRNHPRLVEGMTAAASSAAAGTPFEVEVVAWAHRGRRSGPRTSVQVWASSAAAREAVADNPETLVATLGRVTL